MISYIWFSAILKRLPEEKAIFYVYKILSKNLGNLNIGSVMGTQGSELSWFFYDF